MAREVRSNKEMANQHWFVNFHPRNKRWVVIWESVWTCFTIAKSLNFGTRSNLPSLIKMQYSSLWSSKNNVSVNQFNPLLIFSKGESWVYLFIASWLILNFINHNDNISYDKRSERTWAASSSTHFKLQYPERTKALAYWKPGGTLPAPNSSPGVPASHIQVITDQHLTSAGFQFLH